MWKRRKVRMTNNMRERKKGRLGKGEKSPPPTFSTFLLISSHLITFLPPLSHHLQPFTSLPPSSLFDSFFKSLPNSRVLPQRLFVCTSIISGDKRRPFHRSHANLKPDTLTFLFLFIFASPFLSLCGASGRVDR